MSWYPHIFVSLSNKAPAIDFFCQNTQKSWINSADDKTKIYTPMFSRSVKKFLYFGYMAAGEMALDIRMDQKGCNFTIIIYYYVIK